MAAGAAATGPSVAVAVSGNRSRSRRAVTWAAESLIPVAGRVVLLRVIPSVSAIPEPSGRLVPVGRVSKQAAEAYERDRKTQAARGILPLKELCRTDKEVEILVFDGVYPPAVLLRYVIESGIENLVLGASSGTWFKRILKSPDVPATFLKSSQRSCNIFVVSRHKLVVKMVNELVTGDVSHTNSRASKDCDATTIGSRNSRASCSSVPYRGDQRKCHYLISCFFETKASDKQDLLGSFSGKPWILLNSNNQQSQHEDLDEVDRLRFELQDTFSMYDQACKNLVQATQKVHKLSIEWFEGAGKVKDGLQRIKVLKRIAAEGNVKHLKAMNEVKEARQFLEKVALGRNKAEFNDVNVSHEKMEIDDAVFSSDKRYRRYSRNEIKFATDNFSEAKKIGEGGYGNVYKCNLDNFPVAVKVLREDAMEKKEEFLREVEVLSQLHHPNMLMLLGACPEMGCLIYEYMENGNLEDRLFCRKNTQPLPWFTRFRIIFEVACGLAYLHGFKPKPIVHRDLKPGNILLDQNYVSKIGDVGMAKLMSYVVPDGITEYNETVLAGTLYYMDPEYQITGTLRPKSDLYAFGIIGLQLLTAKSPLGLTVAVENAINDGSFSDILDKSIPDWPLVESEKLAKIALKCSQLRCRDRPDLESEVMPELEELSNMADAFSKSRQSYGHAPAHFFCPILQVPMDNPYIAADGYSYEYRAIRGWLKKHKVSPVTKLKLQDTSIIPNNSLRLAIEQWKSQ